MAGSPLEGDGERLSRQVVSAFAPDASSQVAVDGLEVPIDDHSKRLGSRQRA